MSRRTVFVPYRPKTILNKHRRADHWFWTRYSAYPYVGCQRGCEFCYCRERKYAPYDDLHGFESIDDVGRAMGGEIEALLVKGEPRRDP